MRMYRALHELPESDVSALLHRSGECNCGAFAAPDERQDIYALGYGDWFDATIVPLEREAERLRIPACRWGERPAEVAAPAGPMCSDCQMRLDVIDVPA